MRALLGGVSTHNPCLSARTAGDRYEGGVERGALETWTVLCDVEGAEVLGFLDGDDDRRGAGSSAEEIDMEGTDIVVMNEAITVSQLILQLKQTDKERFPRAKGLEFLLP